MGSCSPVVKPTACSSASGDGNCGDDLIAESPACPPGATLTGMDAAGKPICVADQVSGYTVKLASSAAWEQITEKGIGLVIPSVVTENDRSAVETWRNTCKIQKDINNGVCRNLICIGADPKNRWPILTSVRGACGGDSANNYNNAYAKECSTGAFGMWVGCLYGSEVVIP